MAGRLGFEAGLLRWGVYLLFRLLAGKSCGSLVMPQPCFCQINVPLDATLHFIADHVFIAEM